MACSGCGAKYRSINRLGRQRLAVPAKATAKAQAKAKAKATEQQAPTARAAVPRPIRKINSEIAINFIANLARSIHK